MECDTGLPAEFLRLIVVIYIQVVHIVYTRCRVGVRLAVWKKGDEDECLSADDWISFVGRISYLRVTVNGYFGVVCGTHTLTLQVVRARCVRLVLIHVPLCVPPLLPLAHRACYTSSIDGVPGGGRGC